MGLPRKRQVWLLGICVAILLYITLTCNNLLWKSLKPSLNIDENDPFGYGFRKLLEDDEARLERLRQEGMDQRLPQCIIIGVRKCGTRALLEFLDLHPKIRIADIEMHFFNKDENYMKGLGHYKKYMPYSFPDDITVEKTPRYFISESAPERIFRMNKTIKLIVIFRHPVTRVISDYTQVYQNKLERNKTHDRFEDIVIDKSTGRVNTGYKAVRISMYYHHVTQWLLYFKRSQIHVVDGDNLILHPLEEIQKIEDFLGLEHEVTSENVYFNDTRGFYCMRSGPNQHCLGATKGRKHPSIDPRIIKKLKMFYRPYNKKLFSMIGQTFDWD